MAFSLGDTKVLVERRDGTDRLMPATLTLSDGAMAEIQFDYLDGESPAWTVEPEVESIHIRYPEPASLWRCMLTKSTMFTELPSSRFVASITVLGANLDQKNRRFKRVRISADSLGTWFGWPKVTRKVDDPITMINQITEVPTEQFWRLEPKGPEFGYGVNLNWDSSFRPVRTETLTARPYVVVSFDEPMDLDVLMREAKKFVNFVQFCSQSTFPVSQVFAEGHEEVSDPIQVYAGWKFPKNTSCSILPFIHLNTVRDNFVEHLVAWKAMYSKFPLALDSYELCKNGGGLPIEFRLFSIISALESFHRNLYEEEDERRCDKCRRNFAKTLEQRLIELVDNYGGHFEELLRKPDCAKISATRNYLAHQTDALLAKSIPQEEWFFVFRRLIMVFEICLLCQLPFKHPEARQNIVKMRWDQIRNGSLGDFGLS